MILLAESGSSKTDWYLVGADGNRINSYRTIGFNPFFHDAEFIRTELSGNLALTEMADGVTKLYFYGAGCTSDHNKSIVRNGLIRVFPNAGITVDNDMMAAAYACYSGSPCIIGILGTGSNSARFDGENLMMGHGGLGYVLGDEGGGAYFGRLLLRAYLYHQLPAALMKAMEAMPGMSRTEILDRIYHQPHANVFLAGLAPFMSGHLEDPFIHDLITEGMHEFLKLHICFFSDWSELEVHFTGSVAYFFQSALLQAAKELGIKTGLILQSPVEQLLRYHQSHGFV